MKRSWKGAVLSGLVFPGLGQLWLKHYLRGAALIVTVTAALGVVVVRAAGRAVVMLQQMESEGHPVDLVRIADQATRASLAPGEYQATWALVFLGCCWVAGVVDAFFLGRRMDLAERGPRQGKGGEVPGRGSKGASS